MKPKISPMPAAEKLFATLKRTARDFAVNESGATAVEYGLLVSLICMVIVAAVQDVGQKAVALMELYLAT